MLGHMQVCCVSRMSYTTASRNPTQLALVNLEERKHNSLKEAQGKAGLVQAMHGNLTLFLLSLIPIMNR